MYIHYLLGLPLRDVFISIMTKIYVLIFLKIAFVIRFIKFTRSNDQSFHILKF